MLKVFKFQVAHEKRCLALDVELARIEGGIPVEVIDFATPLGEGLAKEFGVRCLPTMVKVEVVPDGIRVVAALAGERHSRETFERFLEV